MTLDRLSHLAASLGLIAMTACSCPPSRLLGNPEEPYPLAGKPQPGQIVHLPTGTTLTREQMLSAVTDARIVYVGETHDNPASHRLELAVLKSMAARYPGRVALGMEMFTPAQQPVLDRWVAGRLSEKEFLRQSRWYSTWRYNFAYYRALLDFARQEKIPVVGLNAERSMVRAVSRSPLDKLPAAERAKLPEMNLNDPYQKGLVAAIFKGHVHGKKELASFVRVQTLWDETMAANVARYLQSDAGRDRHLVVLAGGDHIRYGFGIPRRAYRRLPVSYVLVGSREIDIPAALQNRLMDVTLPQFPMPPYDYLQYTRYEELSPKPVHLGVLLAEKKGEVRLAGVLPGSAAAAAGLQKGDVLLSMDGEPVHEEFDVIYAVQQKKPGDHSTLVVERDGKRLEVPVTFRETEKKEHGAPRK